MRALQTPEPWGEPIGAWSLALRAAGRTEDTIRLRTVHLSTVARALGGSPWQITTETLTTWAGSRTWARETRRSYRSSVTEFYRWGVRSGRTSIDPTSELPRIPHDRARPHPTPEAIYRDALARAAPRERLAMRLAGEVGLRRGEVARVHGRDLERDLLGWSLRVHGKGGHQRVVPLPDGLATEVGRACEAGGGWAFPGGDDGHLSPAWLGRRVAQLLPGEWTMHSLRHRFATRAYAAERDLLSVQTLLGHASPATTRRYVRLPDDALRRTVQAVAS